MDDDEFLDGVSYGQIGRAQYNLERQSWIYIFEVRYPFAQSFQVVVPVSDSVEENDRDFEAEKLFKAMMKLIVTAIDDKKQGLVIQR